MSRYDSKTTIFSPEGRLYQVEYAMEAIERAGAGIGISTKEGILLCCEKRIKSKLLDLEGSEKIYKLDFHIYSVVAGITADANTLINECRLSAQQYQYRYNTPVPVENLVQHIADMKQSYTQFGGLRPYGVSMIFAGYDRRNGFQLYQSDPSGNFGGWKAIAIGQNCSTANSILRSDWTEDMTMKEAKQLMLKVVQKAMDRTALAADRIEMATVTEAGGEARLQVLDDEEVKGLCETFKAEGIELD